MSIEEDLSKISNASLVAPRDPPTKTIPSADAPQEQQLTPLTKKIRDDAERMSTMVGNLMEEHDRAEKEAVELRARLEQSDSTITDLRSQLESSRARFDQEHSTRLYYQATIEGMVKLAANALVPDQPAASPQQHGGGNEGGNKDQG